MSWLQECSRLMEFLQVNTIETFELEDLSLILEIYGESTKKELRNWLKKGVAVLDNLNIIVRGVGNRFS